ncbi:unnamed protein product, partial [Nesidiocoris tenuis]
MNTNPNEMFFSDLLSNSQHQMLEEFSASLTSVLEQYVKPAPSLITLSGFDGLSEDPNVWMTLFEKVSLVNNWNTTDQKVINLAANLDRGSIAEKWFYSFLMRNENADWETWKTAFLSAFAGSPLDLGAQAIGLHFETGSLLDYFYEKKKLIFRAFGKIPIQATIILIILGLPECMQIQLSHFDFRSEDELLRAMKRLTPPSEVRWDCGTRESSFSASCANTMAISLITEVILLDGFPTTALLDTGSSVDLIRPDVVQSRGMPTKKELRVLRGFNGSLEDVSRSVEANVMMNGYDVKISALIVPNLPYEMIIGLSTLRKLGYELTRKHKNELQTSLPPVSSMANEDPSLPSSILPPAKITPIEFELSPASPQVKSKPYRLSRDKHIWAQDKINEMLTRGIIRPSESKYASPCVIVPKADGSFRLCQDYRAINKFTDLDPFPFPCIDDVISNLGGCKVFSKIDLKDGFHQMPLSEKSKRFTAFVLPFGHYEFNRLPFGWKNSPSKFQRIMVSDN